MQHDAASVEPIGRATMSHLRMRAIGALGVLALVGSALIGVGPAEAASPPPTPPDAPVGSATTYQMTTVHDGLAIDGPHAPLQHAWTRDLGAAVKYPLVVGNRVFVATSRPGGGYGTVLWGLNAQDGSTLWGPVNVGGAYSFAGTAADGANIYLVNADGLLTAFSQATGQQVWSAQMPRQRSFTSAPTVAHGIVYLSGAGSGGTVFAVSAATGEVLWSADVEGGDSSSPAVTDAGVFVSYGCGVSYRFNPSTGHQDWKRSTDCHGGGGSTPVAHDGEVYVRDRSHPGVLDAETGAFVRSLDASATPAFVGDIGIYLQGATLRGIDVATNSVLWSQAGDGGLDTAPLALGSEIAIGSSSGRLYVLDARTGAVDWSGQLGAPINGGDNWTGLAASGGRLFVPASNTLAAYQEFDLDQTFVEALYEDFLDRTPDASGLAHWTGALDEGTSRASVVATIAFSDEAKRQYVGGQYEAILGRAADPAGLDYWTSLNIASLSANQIADFLYASSEYYRDAGGTDTTWIQRLYRDVLHRPASQGDVTYWTSVTERSSRFRVATMIYASSEATNVRVNALFQELLGRPADQTGLAYFRNVVEHIGTPGAAAEIARSPEYYSHAYHRFS